MKTPQLLRGAVHDLSCPQGELVLEPPSLTAVQEENFLSVLSDLSAAGGEFST